MSKRKIKKYRGIIVGAVIVALALAGFYVWRTYFTVKEAEGPLYKTESVEKGTLKAVISGTGNLTIRHEVAVDPVVSGEVISVKVKEGQTVEKGDTLFVLDDTSVESQITAQSASVISACESVARANSSVTGALATLRKFKGQKADPAPGAAEVTADDIEAAEQNLAAARLGLQAANAKLASARKDYTAAVDDRSDLRVKAPCDGTIWTVNIKKGDTVSAGSGNTSASSISAATQGSVSSSGSSGSITIAKKGILGVKLAINEADVISVKEGQVVEVSFDAIEDVVFAGVVDEVAREGVNSSGVVSYDVWVTLDEPDSRLRSGMTAAADVVTSEENDVLLVSNAAVKGSGTDKYVLVMDTNSSAAIPRKAQVNTGTRGATQTVITSGITEGQVIVTQQILSDDAAGAMGSMMPPMGATGAGRGGSAGGPPSGAAPGGNR